MNSALKYLFASVIGIVLLTIMMSSDARMHSPNSDLQKSDKYFSLVDTPTTAGGDTPVATGPLPYDFHDNSYLDPYYYSNDGPLQLKDPANITKTVTFDPDSNQYVLTQTIGNRDYRPPMYMTSDEYFAYDLKQSVHDYWRQRSKAESDNSIRGSNTNLIPPIKLSGKMSDIFGGGTIDIRPQGSAELTFGINTNRTNNPALPERQRSISTFDFNEKIQLNVIGKIGEKLKLTTNYNTESTFEWENQMKLEFTGFEDDIIKKIEAGNVSFGLNTSLITGSQTLFGLKTQLQFGRLTMTSIVSQERGKKSEINVTGGAQVSPFEVTCDNYEANKHFFLSQYFYNNYDVALENFPIVNSGISITKTEVWVTNRTGAVDNTRNIVAFSDLGELKTDCENAGSGFITQNAGEDPYPHNALNSLYNELTTTYVGLRDINSNITSTFAPLEASDNFAQSVNYEKINNARKLTSTEYTVNTRLGFISLNQALNYDEVVAIAYEYTMGGHTYKVGEFSTDGVGGQDALIVKMLKSTNNVPKVNGGNQSVKYKTWDLMMKNIYSIGAYAVNALNFQLQVWYNNPSTGTDVQFLPEGVVNGTPLLQIMDLDKLNQNQAATPDGVFDFIEGVTIISSNGRVIFPMAHPFSKDHFFDVFQGNATLAQKYAYQELYDSTKTVAQNSYAGKNRYKLKGTYQSASNSDISLNAVNIPQGSVVVTAGGAPLKENTDYTVDYTLGRVKIINESILNSGVPIKISLESNSLFNIQTKTLWGTHFDYRINSQFNIGATIMNLTERPVTQKTNIGEEPMSNTVYGTDISYTSEAPWLTRFADHIPFIDTKAPSSISFNGEFAYLDPGHNKAIGKTGTSYIDDFEGTQSAIDIRSPQGWSLCSVPQGQSSRFPEASMDSVYSGMNRAKLSWYVIDPLFQNMDNSLKPDYLTAADVSDHRVREVIETEVFPGKQPPSGQPMNIAMLDLAYYPNERGPYNYDVNPTAFSAGLNANGDLNAPETRWGGIMRRIETNDFEASNVEYIQFWMMDPYNADVPSADQNTEGELIFDLGNISEDVLKDSRNSFENGLPTDGTAGTTDNTPWGRVPVVQSIVNAFDNDPDLRAKQDVGLDGLGDNDETTYFANYISAVQTAFGSGSGAAQNAVKDPSGDNFHYYRGTDYDNNHVAILDRYKMFNGVDGNSPAQGQLNDDGYSETYSTQSTTLPNQEDINRDNTLNETEGYYEYRVKLDPTHINTGSIGTNYITDIWTTEAQTENGARPITWYQFRIPIHEYTTKIGNIENFNSIRFIRMYFRGVDKPVVCRFARLELIRSDWRRYDYSLLHPGEYISNLQTNTQFDLAAVNIEENGNKTPVNYVLPPGIDREQNVQSASLVRLNEQALSMRVCDLEDGDSRAAYKTETAIDVRSYKKIRMFVHAEQQAGTSQTLNDGDLVAFIRIGSDQTDNYYEYAIPLKVTPEGTYTANDETDRYKVWPEENTMELAFELLQNAKQLRNIAVANGSAAITQEYIVDDVDHPGRTVTVKGNPNLSAIKVFVLGIRNPKKTSATPGDDGLNKCAEVWFNELRLTDFDEHGGWAATARVNAKIADLALVNLSGNLGTPGFGSIEKKVSERSRENTTNYDVSAQIEMGKFFNDKYGIKVPLFLGFGETFITPQYNPLDPDILLRPILNNDQLSTDLRDSIRHAAVDYSRRKSFNMTNVHKDRSKGAKASDGHFWDIENFSLSYAYTELYHHNVNLEYSSLRNYRGGLTYAYNLQVKAVKPFENAKWAKSKWLTLIKDLNFYPAPSLLGFTSDLDRQYGETKNRNISGYTDVFTPTYYNKTFKWTRNYDLRWDLSKNIKLNFTAENDANIFEPEGKIDEKWEKQAIIDSLKHFGTTMTYHQSFDASWAIPINKFPLFDWVTPTVKYTGGFIYTRAPLAADTLGNTIGNNSKWDYSVQLNMTTLYKKSALLKKIDAKKPGELNQKVPNSQKPKPPVFKLPMSKADSTKLQQWKDSVDKANKNPYFLIEYMARLMMSVRSVSATYSDNSTISLPGYKNRTSIMGMDRNFESPGWGFVFGKQNNFGPDRLDYPIYASQQGWLQPVVSLITPYTQGNATSLSMRATLEPYPDFKIELTASRSQTDNLTEFYHYDPVTGHWSIASPRNSGTFSISMISWHTAFKRQSKDHASEVFEQFLNNRAIISQRLGNADPASAGQLASGFYDGYSDIQQDVIIPAFMAAYTGHNAGSQSLNLFPSIPLPGWTITYDGLTKYPSIKKVFKTISLKHSYRSTYSLSEYTTNLDWDADGDGFSDNVRNVSGDFLSRYQMNSVSITEQFAPLLSIDMTWNNSLTTKAEFKKDRTLTRSLSNTQLTELTGYEITVGAGYRVPKLPLKFFKKIMKKTPVSDLNIRADISYRNNQTVIRKAVEHLDVLTAGQDIFSIKTSVDYQLTTQLKLRFFCDRIMTNPLISSSFKTANTNAGISLQFMLQ